MSEMMTLRDCRIMNFDKSLIGGIQAGLNDAPVYFNCYPNFTVSLTDKNVLHALTLNIKVHNTEMISGTETLIVITRMKYKVFTTFMNPKAIKHFAPKGEMLLLQGNCKKKGNLIQPRKISWNELSIPTEWKINKTVVPMEQPKVISSTVQRLTEYKDGSLGISFARHNSFRQPPRPIRQMDEARSSCSSIPSTTQSEPVRIFEQTIPDLAGVRNSNIPQPYYTTTPYEQEKVEDDESESVSDIFTSS